MDKRDRRHEISDEQAERLLGDGSPSVRLAPERREALWRALATELHAAPARKRRRASWTRMSLAAGAAAAAVLTFFVAGLFRDAPARIATAVSVSGPCTVSAPGGKAVALRPGTPVLPGQTVQVGRRAAVTLSLPDASKIDLRENTRALYSGLRRQGQTSVRLLRGELRARVQPGSDPFEVGTPVALLRVLGTDFHCRAYSEMEWNAQPEKEPDMRKASSALSGVALLLTVLSGAVEVNAAQASYTVSEGHRALVTGNGQNPTVLQLAQNGYSQKWLNGGAELAPETLFPVSLEPHVLTGLRAVNLETGDVREVTDFLGTGVEVVSDFGGVALVKASSLLFAHFGNDVLGGAGRPFVNDSLYLVNVQTGEKLSVPSLAEYDILYADLSPDRRRLAFVGQHTLSGDDREFGLFVVDLETLQVKRPIEGGFMTAPSWAPDSRWIALSLAEGYASNPEKYRIALIDSLTGEVVETPYLGADIHFSADGKQIVFAGGFKSSGAWVRGVPRSANVYRATLPDGPEEALTSLPEGGAVGLSPSPDGAYIAYRLDKAIRVLNVATKAEEEVVNPVSYCGVEWLNDRRFLVRPLTAEGRDEPLRVVRVGDGPAVVTEYRPEAPTLTPETEASVHAAVGEVRKSFECYGKAVEAQDLHRIDDAVALYGQARDVMVALVAQLKKGEGLQGLLLSEADLQPYLAALEKDAGVTAPERSVQVVEGNLRWYINALLEDYCNEHKRLPEDFKAFVAPALASKWQINHIRCSDTERAKRLFVVPGDDPDAVVTSYEQVETNADGKRLVLRTPVLADGKRMQATYTLDDRGGLTAEVTRPEQ